MRFTKTLMGIIVVSMVCGGIPQTMHPLQDEQAVQSETIEYNSVEEDESTDTETYLYESTDRDEERPVAMWNSKGYFRDSVTYEVIDSRPEMAEETVTLERDLIVLNEGDETFAEEIEEDGITYKLSNVSYSNAEYDLGTASIKETRTARTKEDLAESIVVAYTDPKTGIKKDITLSLTSTKDLADVRTNIDYPFYFTAVDASMLSYGGYEVPNNNGNVPPVAGYENAYLSALADLGVNTENLTISSAEWVTDTYQDDNGVPCRNAVFHCVNTEPQVEGTYGSDAENIGMTDGVKAVAEYTGVKSVETGNTIYTIKAVVHFSPEKGGLTVIQTTLIAVGGTAVVAMGIIAFLSAAGKKKKKNKKENKHEF